MKKYNQSIDTLVLITNRQLLKDDISLATYGAALSRGVERIHALKEDDWMRNYHSLYTLCRDTDLPFEEYLQLCDTIGSTVVYHGKIITNREQLGVVLAKAKRIHLPTNLIRHWQSKQEELWITLQQHFQDITMWSTVHNEDDIKLLASLGIPNLECVLISPIYPTPCKEGHPGIGVSRGKKLLQQIQTEYPHVQGIALGGIHEHNYQTCLQHSFTGVAIMSDFMKQVHRKI